MNGKPGVDWIFKKAVADAGLFQRELGRLSGIHHTLLSMYAQGRYNLTDIERTRIARILKKPIDQVFAR
jgi:hypothetical protein